MTKTTDEMRAELLELFGRFDSDGNGLIDRIEFQKILMALGERSSEQAVTEQFIAVDKDGDGSVQLEEFIAWWLDH